MGQSDIGLIVPVDITALCVGIKDQEDAEGTGKFAGATTTFTKMTGQYDAFLGSNVVRSLADAPLHKLKKGIHLHWALPEALTRGNFDKVLNKTSFAITPNRWILSRLIISNGSPAVTSWIIESDGLYDAGIEPTDAVITLPVKTLTDKEQNYRYAGISTVFTANWQEPVDPGKFKALTGQDLSAVSSGDSSFAAFYPNSRNIFGFYDELAGIDGPVDIMYQLTGWYGTAANDPLNGGKTKEQLEDQFGWTFKDSNATPVYSFYSGLTQAISWDINTSYVVDGPNRKAIPAAMTVGNNPPETFSAYFKERLHPNQAFFEDLLNAFQTGVLPLFREPAADQLALLQELLHGKQFNPADAGIIHLIVQRPDETDVNNPDDEMPVTDLPVQLGIAINQLNIIQQEHDFYVDYSGTFKGQLFANWYRLMKADTNEVKNELDSIIRGQIEYYSTVIVSQTAQLEKQLAAQLKIVDDQISALNAERRIRPILERKETPADRYWQGNEPVLLLTAETFAGTQRFGAAGNDPVSGYLTCRLNEQLLQSIVVNDKTVTATQFTGIGLPTPNKLPQSAVFNALLEESCLLNTTIIASISGIAATTLEASLKTALDGGAQTVYTFTGLLPAAKAVRWWNSNPWNPIMVIWETDFAPLQLTRKGSTLQDYSDNFITNNYSINQTAGGFITYTGASDPTQVMAHNVQTYRGSAILSGSAAVSFAKQLEIYLNDHTDATLQNILDDLGTGKYLSFAIGGFGNALMMKNQDLQLNIKVPENNPYYFLTEAVAEVVGKSYNVSPEPNGQYNPIRAGYMSVRLTAVDVYGQKREIRIGQKVQAASMVSWYKGKELPDIIFMPPRIAQPARLIFRWLSATGSAQDQEMNTHPATTPVCGWLLPNHLDESLFFYDQQGKALGTMFLDGDHNNILWQSAPGDDRTINQTAAEVFTYQNKRFAALANALMDGTPEFFQRFWKAVDDMHNFVNPENYAQNSDLAVLIGRPVAVAQAILRLEAEGSPALNQSWYSLEPEDNQFTGVQFPVILGDLQKMNDGLIGYFKQDNDGYDLSTFYTASGDLTGHVVRPGAANLQLTVSPKPDVEDPENITKDALKVLMLIDPRAPLFATTGILPVSSIAIPPDQYTDIVSSLEMTFLTTPVLRGISGFNLPLPKEEGYTWSWVEAFEVLDNPVWTVTPGISFTTNEAIATYTPQAIREGWLKLTPQLLSFVLLNLNGEPAANAGKVNAFSLKLTNKKPSPVTFDPGILIPEGDPNTGAVFYIHFGRLIADAEVPNIVIALDGWAFKAMNNVQYGNYWVGTPTAPATLKPGATFTFSITNAKVAALTGQVQVYFDYADITGVNNGSDASVISLVV
jgi:hypothetical protein